MFADTGNGFELNDAVPKLGPRRGFKLIKILAAVGIMALLIAYQLTPTYCNWPRARRVQCLNNLKQIALALRDYEAVYGALPPAHTVDAGGRALHSWRTLILPYLDQDALYRTIDLSKPWDDPANAKARETALPVFQCPEAVKPLNTTTYLAVVAPGGCFRPGEPRRLPDITDGTNSTLMVIETDATNAVPWMAPADAGESLVVSPGPKTKFHHAGGFNACFVDGSIKFLKATLPADVRRALISVSGNEALSHDEY